MKAKWNDLSTIDKVITIVSLASSSLVLVFAILQIFNIWDKAINVVIPLMGITMLCQAYTFWNKSRKVAYFSIGAAVFILLCAIGVFLLT